MDEASLIVEVSPIGLYKDMMADHDISVLSPVWDSRIRNSVSRISSIEMEISEFTKGHEKDKTLLFQGPLVELENTAFEGNGKLRIVSPPSTLTTISLPLSQYAIIPFRYFHPERGRKKQTRLEHSVIKEYALYRMLDEISILSRKGLKRKILFETILDGAGISKKQIRANTPEERRKELRRHRGYTKFLESYLDNLCQLLMSEGRIGSYELGKGTLLLSPESTSESDSDCVKKNIKTVPSPSDSVNSNSECVNKHIESVTASTHTHSNISDIAETVGVKQALRLTAVPVPAKTDKSMKIEGE